MKFRNKTTGEVVEWGCIKINSSKVSAQNRVRYYWTNIPDVEQPEDKGILLKDVLLSSDYYKGLVIRDKSKCVRVGGRKSPFGSKQEWDSPFKLDKVEYDKLVHSQKALDYMDRRVKGGRNHWDFKHHSNAENAKSAAVVANFFKGVPYNVLIDNEGLVRRFHPIECERLQTIPDNFTKYGFDTRSQKCYGYGNECNLDKLDGESKCINNVKLNRVINLSQAGKLNCAINTILGLLEEGQHPLAESLSIKASVVKLRGAKETNKLLRVSASSTINNGNETTPELPNHVRFVVERLDTLDGEGYVFVMLHQKLGTETPEELMRITFENLNLMEMKVENITKQLMENFFTGKWQNKHLGGNSNQVKSLTTLTLINLIITKAIFMCTKVTLPTYLHIDSLNELRGNSLEMDLSALRMGCISEISNTNRMRMLGNGWTVDVISHIFNNMEEP